jgi:hypothetical protein
VWVVLAVPVVLAVLVVPAALSGNTIRPIEVVLPTVIALPQTNSAAPRVVIH